jgi:hypothetical protein
MLDESRLHCVNTASDGQDPGSMCVDSNRTLSGAKGRGIRMLYVGVSTIEQNVGAPTIALAESSQCSKWKNKFMVDLTKNLFHVKRIAFERPCCSNARFVRTVIAFECARSRNGFALEERATSRSSSALIQNEKALNARPRLKIEPGSPSA